MFKLRSEVQKQFTGSDTLNEVGITSKLQLNVISNK